MENAFKLIEFGQQNILKMHEGLTIQQLNKVPQGLNNNLVWNYAHTIASVQMICYFRAGLPIRLNEEFVNKYKAGTKPEAFVSIEEYNSFRDLAIEGLEKLKADYSNSFFAGFKPFKTIAGFDIPDFDYAIRYAGHHFGVHQGVTTVIKKLVA